MNEINNFDIESILFDLSKKYILPKYKNLKDSEIKRKNYNELFTIVDIIVEEKLNNILSKLIPDSLFIGEEKFSKNKNILNFYKEKKYCWTVDPIDGTANFIRGKKKFAVMIALTFGNTILKSWIYKPLTQETCYAINGEGTFYNNKKIFINSKIKLNQSSGSISSKYWENNFFHKLKEINNKFREVYSYGCIGYEYIDIANDNRNFAILSKLYPWDHLPGILIVREAGGFDSYFDGGIYNHCLDKKNLIVTSQYKLGNEILKLIKE